MITVAVTIIIARAVAVTFMAISIIPFVTAATGAIIVAGVGQIGSLAVTVGISVR